MITRAEACPLCGETETDYVYESGARSSANTYGVPHVRLVVCPSCGYMCADPMPSIEELRDYYERESSASGAVYRKLEKGSRYERLTARRIEMIESVWGEQRGGPPGRHLDVGCGAGHLMAALSERGWHCVGIEPSESAALAAHEAGLVVHVGMAEAVDLPEASFDLVTCLAVLEHVRDVRAVISRMSRWLSPGGILMLELPDAARPWLQICECYSFEHVSQFTEASTAQWLARNGLKPVWTGSAASSSTSRPAFVLINVAAVRTDKPHPVDVARLEAGRLELISAVEEYRLQRERLVLRTVEMLTSHAEKWRMEGSRVGVYGAGWHTRYLLDAAPIADCVDCVIDSNPLKWGTTFLGFETVGPDAIRERGLGAVVISSATFEEEIAGSLEQLVGNEIEVVRLYS